MFQYLFGNCFVHQHGDGGDEPGISSASGGKKAGATRRVRPSAGLLKILMEDDDRTTAMVVSTLHKVPAFRQLSDSEGDAIRRRDEEDGKKLGRGIDFALSKGVLQRPDVEPSYERVEVYGKSADAVADIIQRKLPKEGGFVVALVGLSGTGKGTTVAKLLGRNPHAVAWSNGNIFRALTLLASTYCVQQGKDFSEEVLTPANIASWMGMLALEERDGKHELRLRGLGMDFFLRDVANTVLKGPMVKRNIPTVAMYSQGEVIAFASKAIQTMARGGTAVLLEGRRQTVDFIPTPHRFELALSDDSVVGQRRAAQRVAAIAIQAMKKRACVFAIDTAVTQQVVRALGKLKSELDG